MAVADKLKEQGWHLSEEGINLVGEDGRISDIRTLIRKALDYDLREISVSSFPEEANKGKVESIPGKIVVQIQKIRNISAPKANEDSRAAPRMLKLSLTDGQTSCQAVELEPITSISLNTPPGTKLYLKTEVPMAHGIILLKPSAVDVLGGKVAHLVEKWELNRSLAKHTRGRIGEEGGPPPWIPFGEKILRSNPQDRNFKSLDSVKDKENRENAEFEAQRKDAIAEAARGGTKKIFGGGTKPLLDHNVQQIVDCGFTVDQAEYALRQNRNNVDRALRTLQRREEGPRERTKPEAKPKAGEERPERRKRGEREEEIGVPPKPSGKVLLFDFFEDKLPVQNGKDPDGRSTVNLSSSTGSYSGIGTDKKFSSSSDNSQRGSSVARGGKSDRLLNSQPRGSGASRGSSSRGGRGGRGGISTSASTWGGNDSRDNRDARDRAGGGNTYRQNITTHKDERSDRGRHSSIQGSNLNSSMQQQQQKPPRFQNQQRLQQQQFQQQQNSDGYGQQQQPWLNSYNDTYSSNNWSVRNSAGGSNNSKSRDDYSNPRESYLTSNYDASRNRPSRTNHQSSGGYSSAYDVGMENQSNRGGLGPNKLDSIGNGRHFPSQDSHTVSHKFNSLQTQHSSSIGRENFNSYSPRASQNQQNQMYTMDYSYKETAPHSPSMMNNPPSSIGNVNSSQGYNSALYSSPATNHYVPENKVWQWHEGDKCMAKYWEDNMYYNAEVTGVSERTCVVRFVDYGNFEEVLQDHCIPFTEDELGHAIHSSSAFNSSTETLSAQNNNQNHFSESQCFINA